jgi:hypothetical protein
LPYSDDYTAFLCFWVEPVNAEISLFWLGSIFNIIPALRLQVCDGMRRYARALRSDRRSITGMFEGIRLKITEFAHFVGYSSTPEMENAAFL